MVLCTLRTLLSRCCTSSTASAHFSSSSSSSSNRLSSLIIFNLIVLTSLTIHHCHCSTELLSPSPSSSSTLKSPKLSSDIIHYHHVNTSCQTDCNSRTSGQSTPIDTSSTSHKSTRLRNSPVDQPQSRDGSTTTTNLDTNLSTSEKERRSVVNTEDKYAPINFHKRTLKQFVDDMGFNFAPQVDMRDFSRVMPYQSFPQPQGPPPPPMQPSRGFSPEDIGDYPDIDPNVAFNRDAPPPPPPQRSPPPPESPSINFAPRQSSFQRVRIPQPQSSGSQQPPLPPPPPPASSSSSNSDRDVDDRHSSSPANDAHHEAPRFQRIRRPSIPDRSERPPIPPPLIPENNDDSPPVSPNRSPSSGQQFRRLPINRNRQPVSREPEERLVRRPSVIDSDETTGPLRPSINSEEFGAGPPSSTTRPRRVKPTSNGSRRIRPVNRNRINGNGNDVNRSPVQVNPLSESIVPTAVVITKPPQTPVPVSSEDVETEIGGRLPPSRETPIRNGAVRLRRPINGNGGGPQQPGFGPRRRVPKPSVAEIISSTRFGPESSVAPDEESAGNNAVDSDVNGNAIFGSKIRDDPVALTKTLPLSTGNNGNGPIVVDYMTVFTYLTTVIRGPHTLVTSHESTTRVHITQPYDPSIVDIVSNSAGVIRPTKTVNLGTKTKGPTTTIVNMQSNVQIANFEFVSGTVKPNRIPQPSRTSSSPAPELRRTRKPIIETAPKHAANILKADQLRTIPKTFYTQHTYFYTVYDGAKTRRSTRSELITARVPETENVATLTLDSTINRDGLLSLGSGPSTVNIGKRVFGGSTTEVNLAMKTYLKLDGIQNAVIEPSATRQPYHSLSHEITIRPTEPNRGRPTLPPTLEASTPPLIESGLSSLPELDQPESTPIIIPISSDIRNFRTRRPVRVSSTAVNPDTVRSRAPNGRFSQRVRPRPNFSRIQRPKLSSPSLDSEYPPVISSSFSPELESLSSLLAASSSDILNLVSPTASISGSEVLESDAVSSAIRPKASSSVRRPYTNNALRSRLRRPPRPQATSEPKYVIVTRSASSPSTGPSSSPSLRSSKGRYRVASRIVRPGSSPVDTSLSSPVVTDIESIIPSSSVLITYISTTTHTVPFTMNDKTLMTTFEETNSRVATEPLDQADANRKVTRISDGVTLLMSGNIEPTSPITLRPTLVSGAAVHMRDGLKDKESHNDNVNRDMETKTVFTTYTYFTTFYSGSSSKVSSSEQVVSNVITQPKATQILPTSSIRPPVTIVETSEKIETSTIYSTYTYFATLFNGSRSTITPIEETRSEILTLREPIRITRTINPAGPSATNSLFTRTYYTTYTKAFTFTENNVPKTSRKEEVVSNVVTFTLSGHRETPALDINRIYTTQTINQLSAYPSLLTTKSTYVTSTHFITLFNGSQTILSSVEEIAPTVVTQIIGQPSAANNQRIPYSRIQSNIVPSSSISVPQKSRDLMTALSPSISTLHITHTYYTTYFNGHTSTVESRTEATSSLVTLYVPQNGKQSTGSAPSAINGRDQIGSVFKSGDYNIQSTPVLPNQLRSSVDNIPYRKRGSTVSPSLQSTRRVDQFESSILSRVVESLKASQGLSDEQISSAIFGGHGMGKSTTVIGGSTVVFFTNLILSPSSSSVFGVKSTISPSKTIELNGEGTAIKPGTVIELSDLLGGHANANLPGGLGSAIKDIVHLIASNSNGANNNKFNESMVDFDSDDHMPPGGMVKVKPDLEPVYIPIGGKHKSPNNSPVNVDGGSSSSSSSDTSRSDGEPVYRPDLTLEESGSSSSSSSSSSESSSSSSSSSDESGRNGGYMRKNDIYHRKNQNLLESSHRSHPHLASSINSVGSSPSSGSSGYETTPLSNGGSAHTQVQGGATTIFFTDGLESSMINIGGQQPSLSTTPTRYITSVESMTRTLTLTTTKVYYTRDSPLTITSELTTTIPPRTFVSTIIGSRTILGTAGEATKTVDVDSKSASNDEVTTTVTTTTLIFNSITTTVVRTLVIPTAIQATRTTPVSTRPSRKPYTPYRPPRPSTTPPSVSIRPPGSRTRSPYLAKYKPSTPRPTSPSPSDSETMNTLNDSDDTTKITSVPPKLFDDDQCKPACNTANKEICREIDGIFRCECRPGYARKEGSTVCEAMQVYLLVVRLMKVGENPVSYNTDLSDSSSGEYQKIARLAKEEIEKAYRNTSIKDTYLGADVNMIKSPSDGDDGVLVNMTVHLAAPRGGFTTNGGANGDGFDAENEFNLNDMHNELSRTLAISDKSSETLPNPSSIVADIETLEDFDECSDEKYNDCDLAARCINKPGSYVCECKGAYTDMDPNLPGRVCAAEIKNCEACHGRGDCVRSEDGEKTTCKCQRMYLGERCEINGLLLATFLPIAAVLSIVSVCCIVYCCRKYKKKSNYPKGFKNLVAYPPQTIGANTLDRKAMLETSSESSEHFRHAGHDGTNGMGHYPSGNGSTRRHGHPDMERSMGPGAFVAMPPQVTIPRARHLNQNSDGCENITMNPKSCMRDDMSNGHGAHHRESSPEQFSRDRESFSRQQGRQTRSQSRCGSRIGSRAESRSESRCNHREEDFMAKDFIEWTPKRASFHEKACESERDQFSEHKAKSHRAFGDLRISPFDWQWKMLKQTSGSYSPNTRGKKKSLTDDRTPFGGSYIESPITSHKRRYHDTRDSQLEKSQHNLSLVSERDESVVSYSTTWTGGPAQYHVADDLISLERRSQVSNWGRLPFYDN